MNEAIEHFKGVFRYYLSQEYINETITIDEFKTTIPLPKSQKPWWTDYKETGIHEPLATRTLVNSIEENDVIWDIGSKYGYFGHLAAELSNPKSVHVFEANPYHYAAQLRPWNERAWDGKVSILNRKMGGDDDGNLKGDDYARRTRFPDFIKMDIDGAEAVALDGLTEVISEYAPTMLIEVHPQNMRHVFEKDTEDALDPLTEHYDLKVSWAFRETGSNWQPLSLPDDYLRARYTHYFQILAIQD